MDPIAALRLQDDRGMALGWADGVSRGVAGRRLSARRGGAGRLALDPSTSPYGLRSG